MYNKYTDIQSMSCRDSKLGTKMCCRSDTCTLICMSHILLLLLIGCSSPIGVLWCTNSRRGWWCRPVVPGPSRCQKRGHPWLGMIGIERVLCATAFRTELNDGHLRFELVPRLLGSCSLQFRGSDWFTWSIIVLTRDYNSNLISSS